jgi:hypothetical protein
MDSRVLVCSCSTLGGDRWTVQRKLQGRVSRASREPGQLTWPHWPSPALPLRHCSWILCFPSPFNKGGYEWSLEILHRLPCTGPWAPPLAPKRIYSGFLEETDLQLQSQRSSRGHGHSNPAFLFLRRGLGVDSRSGAGVT